MGTIYHKRVWQLLIFAFLFFLSCSDYEVDEKKTNEVYTLQIDWKNAQQAQINYPLWVYFFTEKGIFIKKEQIQKADAVKEWQLPKGNYQYCLLSGFDEKDYQLPLEYGFSSYFSPNKLLEKPLLTGNATILLSQNLRSTVALEYAVAKIEFLLTAMPDDITEIKAMITPVYSGYAFDGNYWDVDKTHAISLTHFDKGEWRSLPTYIFPSDKKKITINITLKRKKGEESYSMNYTGPLKAGTPYRIKGSFRNNELALEQVEVINWQPTEDVDFPFIEDPVKPKPEDNTEGTKPAPPATDVETITSDVLPRQGEFWRNMFVCQVKEASAEETRVLLLAPVQWYCKVVDANGLLNAYRYEGLSAWRFLAIEEARAFTEYVSDKLEVLNTQLAQKGQDLLITDKGKRYLCDDGNSTFSFTAKTILKAGGTVKYYVRGVKEVIIRKP